MNHSTCAPPPHPWIALCGICLAVTMYALDASILNIALPTLLTQFSCSLQSIQWVMLSYFFSVLLLLLPAAKFARRFGQKRLFLSGIIVFVLGSLLCGLSWSLPSMILFRLIQGAGAASIASLMSSVITNLFPEKKLGRALGFVTTFATLGTSLGPSIGGYLISLAGWPWIFLVNLPVGILSIFLVAIYVPALPPTPHAPSPQMLPLLQNTRLTIALCTRTSSMMLNAAFLFLAPFLLQRSMGFPVEKAGFFLAATPVFIGVCAPVIGFLCDRFGSRHFNLAGVFLLFLSVFSLASFYPQISGWGYLLRIFLLAAGLSLLNAPNNKIIMHLTPPADRPSASAFLSLSILIGQALGVWGASFLFRQISQFLFGSSLIFSLSPSQITTASNGVFLCFAPILLAVFLANLLPLTPKTFPAHTTHPD